MRIGTCRKKVCRRVVCFRDSNTVRLIQTLALEVKWRISPPDIGLSGPSLYPVWAPICICASSTADAKILEAETVSYTLT